MMSLPNKKFIFIILGIFLLLIIFFAPARNVVVRFFVAVSRPFLKPNNKDGEVKILNCNSMIPVAFSVISRPPQSPYDILIIDDGSDSGVRQGAKALFSTDVLLGYVSEVFGKTSKIKLVSFPGEETSVMIEPVSGGTKISALAVGRGGGEMEIKIPSAIEIHSGDLIKTPGNYPLILGAVEKIETNLSDPFQLILFRLPINLQELDKIMIEK
jgi:cell shape-determining protein MreC